MKTKTFIIAVLLLVVALPARADQLGGTPSLVDDCGCDCQSKKDEQVAVAVEEARLNEKINELVDSVEGKLDLPENAGVAAEVKKYIEKRDRLADKRRSLQADYLQCLRKRDD